MTPLPAYRGYYIQKNPFTGEWTVSRDGHHICTQASEDLARAAIDMLLDGE